VISHRIKYLIRNHLSFCRFVELSWFDTKYWQMFSSLKSWALVLENNLYIWDYNINFDKKFNSNVCHLRGKFGLKSTIKLFVLTARFMFCCLSSRIHSINFVWDLISRLESSSRFTFWATDSNIIIFLLNRFLKSFITIKFYSNILYFRLKLRDLINFRLIWNICAPETRLDRCVPNTCNLCHDFTINPFIFRLYIITIRPLSSTQID